jgi:hypothetical protein
LDALTFLKSRTRTRRGQGFYIFLCLLPIVGGIIAKLIGHDWAFMDIDAVLCAAKAEAAGHSPYGALKCSGIDPAPYVYAPQVLSLFQPLVVAFGALGARLVFIFTLLLPATGVLLWFAIARAMPGPERIPKSVTRFSDKDARTSKNPELRSDPAGSEQAVDWRWRLLAFSGLSPMTFCCGNIGIVMHAAVLLSLLLGKERRWPFIVTVLLCVAIKPTFMAYFVLFLFEDKPWKARLASFAGCAAEGLGVTGLMAATTGPWGSAWWKAMHEVTLETQPGLGWMALTSYIGLHSDWPVTVVLSLGFTAAMVLAGLAIAEWGGLDDRGRLLLTLGVAPLMTPRLMDYDMVLIVPYAALLMSLTPRLKMPVLEKWLPWVFVAVLAIGIACNILHFKRWHRTHVAMFLFCSLTLVMAARLAVLKLSGLKKKNEEGMLPDGGKGDVLPSGKAVRALFNPDQGKRSDASCRKVEAAFRINMRRYK